MKCFINLINMFQDLHRKYDHEFEQMERNHKQQIENMEKQHDWKRNELINNTSKEQERKR